MTNREVFKTVFNKDIQWSKALEPQILALKSAHIVGVDCMEEWLNAEYKRDKEMSLDAEIIFTNTCLFIKDVLTELDNIDDYAARLEKYGEEDKAEGLFEASARIRNTMQKVLDCPPEKEGE